MRVPVKSMLGIALSILSSMSFAAEPSVLELVTSIPLPGVKGRIDHLSIDVEKARLFVAALGNNSVEVIDLKARRLERSLGGFGEPQGVLYLSAGNRLYVANGSADRVDLLDATSLTLKKRFTGLSDADNVRFDAAAGKVYVGYGRGALRVIDVASETLVANVALAGHRVVSARRSRHAHLCQCPHRKSDRSGRPCEKRSCCDVADARCSEQFSDVARRNQPSALCRRAQTCSDAGVRHNQWQGCGTSADRRRYGRPLLRRCTQARLCHLRGGTIDVFRQATPDQYAMVERIRTAPRARTGLFVAGLSQLYVAAPAADGNPARILIYDIH